MAVTLVAPQQQLGSSDPGTQVYVVIGSSADVTAGRATHTWATAQALNGATGPATGTAVKVLASAGALTANLLWTAANLIVVGESNNVTVPLGGFTFTISGATCFVDLIFSGAIAGSVTMSGTGSQVVSPGLVYPNLALGAGARADLMGAASSIYLGGSDANSGFTARQLPSSATNVWNDVDYSPSLGLYVAVGNSDGTNPIIATSPDAKTWTMAPTRAGGAFALYSVIWAAALNLFVAVGNSNGTNPIIVTSANGTSWAAAATIPATNNSLLQIAFNGTTLVAVGISGIILTSTTGSGTWTAATSAFARDIRSVVWNGSLFCATGITTVSNTPTIQTSANGTTGWTAAASVPGIAATGDSVVWTGSKFVMAGSGTTFVLTSPTGSGTWTQVSCGVSIGSMAFNPNGGPLGLLVGCTIGSGMGCVYSIDNGATFHANIGNVILGYGSGGTPSRTLRFINGLFFFFATLSALGVAGSIFTSPDAALGTTLYATNTNRLYAGRQLIGADQAIAAGWRAVLAVQPEVGPAGVNAVDFLLMRGPACTRTDTSGLAVGNTATLIHFATAGIDTNSNWDGTNFRFTPTVPGLYWVNLSLVIVSDATAADIFNASIRKNGTTVFTSAQQNFVASDTVGMSVSGLVDCNGMDYIDFAVLNLTAARGALSTTALYNAINAIRIA